MPEKEQCLRRGPGTALSRVPSDASLAPWGVHVSPTVGLRP